MDKPHDNSAASPGYETRDANVRGVFNFLVFLASLLVVTGVLCWGLFRYLSKRDADAVPASPFAETRQLPLGPQLQVNPRQDWLKYHDRQEQSLETYAWENRGAGIVRVPIERAMEVLLQKGLPVQNSNSLPSASASTPAPSAPQGGKKP
jgi:hypothetical protein